MYSLLQTDLEIKLGDFFDSPYQTQVRDTVFNTWPTSKPTTDSIRKNPFCLTKIVQAFEEIGIRMNVGNVP